MWDLCSESKRKYNTVKENFSSILPFIIPQNNMGGGGGDNILQGGYGDSKLTCINYEVCVNTVFVQF